MLPEDASHLFLQGVPLPLHLLHNVIVHVVVSHCKNQNSNILNSHANFYQCVQMPVSFVYSFSHTVQYIHILQSMVTNTSVVLWAYIYIYKYINIYININISQDVVHTYSQCLQTLTSYIYFRTGSHAYIFHGVIVVNTTYQLKGSLNINNDFSTYFKTKYHNSYLLVSGNWSWNTVKYYWAWHYFQRF